MRSYLDFEKPVAEIEAQLEELRGVDTPGEHVGDPGGDHPAEAKASQTLKDLYANLTLAEDQVARHPERPRCLNYVQTLVTDFVPLAGDRKFGEDEAIVGGFAASAARASACSGTRRADHQGGSAHRQRRGRRATARRCG
jgi:acetyl-CoA carboxylase carboxyl transferase subunit alpha